MRGGKSERGLEVETVLFDTTSRREEMGPFKGIRSGCALDSSQTHTLMWSQSRPACVRLLPVKTTALQSMPLRVIIKS